jgi:LacI family transcriptional regulator
MKKIPTIRHVAKKANVSVATVSRAINSPESVRPETLRKVQSAIQSLGFSPNIIARSLKVKESRLIGIIIPDIMNPFFARIVRGAENVLSDHNLTAIICDSEENQLKEDRYLLNLFERRVDGLIIIPSKENSKIPQLIGKKTIPIIFVDRYFSNEYDSIKGNNFSGISLLVSHLVSRGYTRIGIINGPLETLPGRERAEAFLKALSLHGIGKINGYTESGDFTSEDGYRIMKNYLQLKKPPEAVVAANNFIGVGALRAIKEQGLKVPDDIGIVVFDEVHLADLADPPLTVVVQPAEEMGKRAALLLIERIQGQNSVPHREIVFEPLLIVRESTV